MKTILKIVAPSCIQLLLVIGIAYIIVPYTHTWLKNHHDQLTSFFVFQYIIFIILAIILVLLMHVISKLFRIPASSLPFLIFIFLFRTTLLALFTANNYLYYSNWLNAIVITSAIIFIWDVLVIYQEKKEQKEKNKVTLKN